MNHSLAALAHLVQGTVVGSDDICISSLSPIDNISAGSLVFADNLDKLKLVEQSTAAAVLVHHSVQSADKPLIQVAQPMQAFIRLLEHFSNSPKATSGIHPSAVIAADVQLGHDVSIGAYVVIESGSTIGNNAVLKSHIHIGHNVVIGERTTLHPHVTVYDNCRIGSDVTIHASTVVGSDGFGYTFVDNQHLKIPHIGHVVIHDHVEIGANTAIDRATLGATVIGAGTKIDNLVQVAHSVQLGKNNILCGFTGIAGSTTTGNNVIFAANVGVSDHVRIDDGVILGARAGVPPNKHLKAGNIYLGSPARPKDLAIKQDLSVNRIPLMRKNIKMLMEQMEQVNQRLAQSEER